MMRRPKEILTNKSRYATASNWLGPAEKLLLLRESLSAKK